jgi:vancomycin resistance protein YoaR
MRAKFFTTYYSSSEERISNIKLASQKINGVFLDVNEEFSFNNTVGERTADNGYKNSKIILGGKFTDGVGGGVCQVSTTLYNAVLLAGLNVTESHPHSLAVSYVAPSFDAMVSFNLADLKFVNDTGYPVLIKAFANDYMLTVSIFGRKMQETYVRSSIITGEIPAPKEETFIDTNNEYPDINFGEQKVISYSKKGLTSEGSLIKMVNGKPVKIIKIRKDAYRGTKGLIVVKPTQEELKESAPGIDKT